MKEGNKWKRRDGKEREEDNFGVYSFLSCQLKHLIYGFLKENMYDHSTKDGRLG